MKPVRDLLRSRSSSEFTPDMERIVRVLLQKLSKSSCPAFLHETRRWTGRDRCRSTATLADTGLVSRSDSSSKTAQFAPVTFFSRVILPNESSWTILGLKAATIILATKRLRVHLLLIPFPILRDHALEHLDKVGWTPRSGKEGRRGICPAPVSLREDTFVRHRSREPFQLCVTDPTAVAAVCPVPLADCSSLRTRIWRPLRPAFAPCTLEHRWRHHL